MYRLGHHPRHRYWLYGVLLPVAVCSIGGFVWWARLTLQPQTVIAQSRPYVGTVPANGLVMHTVTEQAFSIGLPQGWKSPAPPAVPYTVYSWQGSGKDAARRLDLYIDTIPANLAVNRLLPITQDGDGLSIAGDVSDNCIRFTARTAASAATGAEPARWNGVNFLCDVGNYERDVVGTGSPIGVNTVVVSGPATGVHKVFFVYTDNSASPDYTIFESIIKSFQAL